jgi:surface antigen
VKRGRVRRLVFASAILVALALGILWFNDRHSGEVIDRYKGVAIYDNGPLVVKSHGRHYSASGYYWGQKWQCVEFVKRFYDEAKQHQMPDVWGHAKDFFDATVPHGGLNKKRGLTQFRNGGDVSPAPDDLFIFGGGYGHVGIVSEVGTNFVEIAQQNIYRKPRQRFGMTATNGTYRVESVNLLGWLRMPARQP